MLTQPGLAQIVDLHGKWSLRCVHLVLEECQHCGKPRPAAMKYHGTGMEIRSTDCAYANRWIVPLIKFHCDEGKK